MAQHLKTVGIVLMLAIAVKCFSSDGESGDFIENDNLVTSEMNVDAKPNKRSRGALGQGFQIHKEDLLTKDFRDNGAKIFEKIPIAQCTTSAKLAVIEKDDTFFSNTESLYQAVSTSTKVEGSLKGAYTLGVSVAAVTNNIASSEEEVQGVSLNIKARSLSSSLKKSCINSLPLSQDLVDDFEALETEIVSPWLSSSWRSYKVFLDTYGSHIVQETISGSSIYQYAFAKTSLRFSQRDLTVKACLSISGTSNVGEVGLSACSGVSQEEIDSSSSKSMIMKLVVRGGKTETRADLVQDLSQEKINSFLKEAETDPSPILYKFYALWDIIKSRYIGTEHFAKAVNLEQYYKGYLHFGCSYQHTTTATDGKKLDIRKFELAAESDPQAPTYVCKLGPEGCHDHEDCHYRASFWCECGGPYDKARSCLRYKTKSLKSGTTKKEAYPNKESGFAWHGCERSGFACWCTGKNSNGEEAWSGENADQALRDVHMRLMDDKREKDQMRRHYV